MIVKSKLWHYLKLIEQPLHELHSLAINSFYGFGDLEHWAIDAYKQQMVSWTLIDDEGFPIGVFALNLIRPKVAYAWAVGTPEALTKYPEWSPFIRTTFDDLFERTDIHRVECNVVSGFAAAERTVLRYGFELEGTQKMAGSNKEDALLYARTVP